MTGGLGVAIACGAKGLVTPACSNPRQCTRPSPPRRSPSCAAFADGVTQTLGVARGLVEAGRHVDLAGLEDQVGLLCAKALDLPPEEGRECARSATVLARVEALSVALLRARGATGGPADRPAE